MWNIMQNWKKKENGVVVYFVWNCSLRIIYSKIPILKIHLKDVLEKLYQTNFNRFSFGVSQKTDYKCKKNN